MEFSAFYFRKNGGLLRFRDRLYSCLNLKDVVIYLGIYNSENLSYIGKYEAETFKLNLVCIKPRPFGLLQ